MRIFHLEGVRKCKMHNNCYSMFSINIVVAIYTSSSIAQNIFPHVWGIRNYFGLCQYSWLASCNSAPVPLSLCALICINPK